jgi:type II secretory pathway component PulC
VLAAKGTMTKNALRTQVNIPKDLGQQIDPLALMGKHHRTLPRMSRENVLGMTAKNISQIPLAAQMGFQDNDIISSVNGIPVQSIEQIMLMAPQFNGVKDFDVNVIRNGQNITIPISIN